MKPVFLDSVGLIALWVRKDQWHSLASREFTRLLSERREFVTTPFVLTECGNAASRRAFRRDVVELRHKLEANSGVIYPTDDDWTNAWAEYERGRPGDPGIVDCTPSPSCDASVSPKPSPTTSTSPPPASPRSSNAASFSPASLRPQIAGRHCRIACAECSARLPPPRRFRL